MAGGLRHSATIAFVQTLNMARIRIVKIARMGAKVTEWRKRP